MFGKVDKLGDLWDTRQAEASLIRSIPALSDVLRQGKIFNIVRKKAYATSTYTNKKHLNLQLPSQQIHKQTPEVCALFYQYKQKKQQIRPKTWM